MMINRMMLIAALAAFAVCGGTGCASSRGEIRATGNTDSEIVYDGSAAMARVDHVEASIAALSPRVDRVEGSVNSLSPRVDGVTGDVSGVKADIAAVRADVVNLSARVGTVERTDQSTTWGDREQTDATQSGALNLAIQSGGMSLTVLLLCMAMMYSNRKIAQQSEQGRNNDDRREIERLWIDKNATLKLAGKEPLEFKYFPEPWPDETPCVRGWSPFGKCRKMQPATVTARTGDPSRV